MQADLKKAYLQLHLAVFIFGFTAIIGKCIEADHFTLVWHRMWIAAVGFLFVPGFISALKTTTLKNIVLLAGIGAIVALHWLTFYGSVKIGGSASITLGCFGLTSTFTSLLEPLIYRKKFIVSEILLGLMAVLGILVIAYSTDGTSTTQGNYTLAIIVGVVSSFLAALFSTINSTIANKIDTKVISFGELSGGFLFLCLILLSGISFQDVLPIEQFQLIPMSTTGTHSWSAYTDIFWILILAVICTNIAFVLSLNSMKKVSAFTANLSLNLEPVYGFILAAIFFKEYEYLNLQFYIGTLIILSSVIIHSILKSRAKH